MAAGNLLFLKCPASLVFLRCLKDTKQSLKICRFSTCKALKKKEEMPVKFTMSQAAKVSIAETTGLKKEGIDSKFRRIMIVSSLGIFLLYFCVFREENDLDELLSGNSEVNKSEELELIDLKIKLAYCEKNNLPTRNIKARIEEIVNNKYKPVFPK